MVFRGAVPEDIWKHEYICIFYWLFISVHILLVQTQTVLEVLGPKAPTHLSYQSQQSARLSGRTDSHMDMERSWEG